MTDSKSSNSIIPKVKEIEWLKAGTFREEDIIAVTKGTVYKINLLIKIVNELVERENKRMAST